MSVVRAAAEAAPWSQGTLRDLLQAHIRWERKSHFPQCMCVCGWEGGWDEHVDHLAQVLAQALAPVDQREVGTQSSPMLVGFTLNADGTRSSSVVVGFTRNADGTWTQQDAMEVGNIDCLHKEKYIDDEGLVICAHCDRGARA